MTNANRAQRRAHKHQEKKNKKNAAKIAASVPSSKLSPEKTSTHLWHANLPSISIQRPGKNSQPMKVTVIPFDMVAMLESVRLNSSSFDKSELDMNAMEDEATNETGLSDGITQIHHRDILAKARELYIETNEDNGTAYPTEERYQKTQTIEDDRISILSFESLSSSILTLDYNTEIATSNVTLCYPTSDIKDSSLHEYPYAQTLQPFDKVSVYELDHSTLEDLSQPIVSHSDPVTESDTAPDNYKECVLVAQETSPRLFSKSGSTDISSQQEIPRPLAEKKKKKRLFPLKKETKPRTRKISKASTRKATRAPSIKIASRTSNTTAAAAAAATASTVTASAAAITTITTTNITTKQSKPPKKVKETNLTDTKNVTNNGFGTGKKLKLLSLFQKEKAALVKMKQTKAWQFWKD
ncbi:hypothetical protein BDF14DRAFT_1957163 [Spinellus fusiger]|nr:hypothetical protein BDF14DRAFT_1957163 [Spinellus fusiger]